MGLEVIGIRGFLGEGGCGGRVRERAEDFVVEEVWGWGVVEAGVMEGKRKKVEDERGEGNYLHLTLEKKNRETLGVLRELARKLGISGKRIGYAGLKDKKAITAQRISIEGVRWGEVREIEIRGAVLHEPEYRERGIRVGEHEGNRFTVRIREPEGEPVLGRFPNFFGPQRFGSKRPVTHLVGREIVKGNYEEALWLYLTFPGREREEVVKARKRLGEERDIRRALEYFPRRLRYERRILGEMAKGKEPEEILRSFPLTSLFIHAYQSYLFNLFLSERLKREKGVGGDILVEGEPTSILPGSKTTFTPGLQGRIERGIMKREGVRFSDFRDILGKEYPGERRKLFERPREVEKWREGKDWVVRFTLGKGVFATALLREVTGREVI